MSAGRYKSLNNVGINYHKRSYNNNTRLDAAEANVVFSTWYNKKTKYNYRGEPSNNAAGKLKIQHRNCIIIFLV